MPNYLKIQSDVDSKLRQNGALFELVSEGSGIYNPTTGTSSRETKIIKAFGIKTISKFVESDNFKVKYGDFLLLLSAIDENGDQYDCPSKGTKVLIDGVETEVVDSVIELNFTGIPVLYKFILKGI